MKVILSKEELPFQVQNYYVIIVTVLSLSVAFFISKSWGRKAEIPGWLGLPFIGETFSFFSATNSTKGCYNFVKLRRLRLVILLLLLLVSDILDACCLLILIQLIQPFSKVYCFTNHNGINLFDAGIDTRICAEYEMVSPVQRETIRPGLASIFTHYWNNKSTIRFCSIDFILLTEAHQYTSKHS